MGLIASDADRADLVRLYQMVDLDNDGEISLEELLQHYRAKYNPIDLKGSLAPFDAVKDEVFDYMRCRAKPTSDVEDCNATGYTREDLKLALPMLYTLDNIIGDNLSFENYVTHEFLLRDLDENGVVEKSEQNRYDWHYKFIRGFWNHSKGAGNVRETIPDDGIMTFEQWNKQDNMMLKRDYPNSDIPEERLRGTFEHQYDVDKNGELSWWEYWSTIQQSHHEWYHWNIVYDQMN